MSEVTSELAPAQAISEHGELLKTIDTLLAQIKDQLDRLTPFAIETLNPYDSEDYLYDLAEKTNQGNEVVIVLGPCPGMGEVIQGEYIKNFLRHFFPKITFLTNEYPLPEDETKKVIKIKMVDFDEAFRAKTIGMPEFLPEPSEQILFSMVQTKIIHSSPPSKETVEQLRSAILKTLLKSDSSENAENITICVGDINQSYLLICSRLFCMF